jgi:hypothetical protein
MDEADKIATAFEQMRHATQINHHVLCRCGHRRLLHQFDEGHEGGTCTIAGCACAAFARGLAGVA